MALYFSMVAMWLSLSLRPAVAGRVPLSEAVGNKPTNIVFIGNPGAGKSTLLNGLSGKPTFKAGVAIGGGLTYKLDQAEVPPHTLLDTPGLADIQKRKEAAKAITAALQKDGNYNIVFVLTLENGRLRPDDVTTMRLVLEAAPVIGSHYGILVNKLSKKTADKLQDSPEERNKLVAMMLETLPNPSHYVTWILHDEKLADEENQVAELPAHFLSWLREFPSVEIRPQQVQEIKADKFEELREQLGRQLEDLKNRNDELHRIIAAQQNEMREVNALFERQLAVAQAQAQAAANRANQLEKATRGKR